MTAFPLTECPVTRDRHHRYSKGDRKLVAVSRVLEVEGLKPPFRDAPDGEDPEAYKLRGKAAHEAVIDDLLVGTYSQDRWHPVIHPYVQSMITWADHVGGIELVRPSSYVWSDSQGTAGEFDLLVRPLRPRRRTDRLWLLDLKTSRASGGMPEAYVGVQMGGYSSMLRECYGIKVDSLICVLLRDSGKPDSSEFDVVANEIKWRSAVNMYHHKMEYNLIPKNLRAA